MPTDGRRRARLRAPLLTALLVAPLVALLTGLLALWLRAPGAAPPAIRTGVQAAPAAGARVVDPAPAGVRQDAAARRRVLQQQVRLADHTYCSYLQHTRYPHGSRPAGHHPDQLYPNQPVLDAQPMRIDGAGSDAAILLHTSQSRVYLAAGEAVAFSVHASGAGGNPVALVVTSALAQGMTYGASRAAPRVNLAFAGADDGVWSASLAPSEGPLTDFHGTIRIEVRYSAAGRKGFVLFDVVHSPAAPAVWAGPVGEGVEAGALRFTLPLDVREAGRYVVSGRIDDARGRPFALASFNEVLGPGRQAVTLDVFGALLHDGAPAMPLRLRDVEGYLLREDRDPDRLLLPRREGKVFDSRTRSLDGIPDDEWQSEERSRYLAEYAQDRVRAHARLRAAYPAGTLPDSACPMPAQPVLINRF